jgi:hypothetical protein
MHVHNSEENTSLLGNAKDFVRFGTLQNNFIMYELYALNSQERLNIVIIGYW